MKEFIKYIFNILAISIVYFICFFIKRPQMRDGVLIVRTDNIGDLIIFSPYLKKISEYYNTFLTIIVSETVEEFAKSLKERGFPIKNIIVVHRKKFNNNFLYKIKFLLKINRQSYEAALSPAFSRESIGDTIITISCAREKIGFSSSSNSSKKNIKKLYDQVYTNLFSGISETSKEVKKNAYFLSKLTGTSQIEIIYPTTIVSDEDRNGAKNILKERKLEGKRFIFIAPGAAVSFRIWPAERYAEIADFVNSLGYQVVIGGLNTEELLIQDIIAKAKLPIINIIGETPIFILAALLKKSSLFIGSESAILHLAATVDTPALCIMGGGHFRRFYPYFDSPLQQIVFDKEMKCMNDNWNCARNLPTNQPSPCINGITTDMVKRKIKTMVNILE